MHREELRDILARHDEQMAAIRTRIRGVQLEISSMSFRSKSADGRAIATVSDSGTLTELSVPLGLGNKSQPSWVFIQQLAEVGAAITEAVNKARSNAVTATMEGYRREFPAAFELLEDLRPYPDGRGT
ncbi:YbaB/EbfC family nucleoid-associated protein [Nocardia sp. NPDC127579]|uniref:YbaB/EbfC family nucleoid-associated protein n=1 Tax=Nocardia sp. NPDC127579 TaxID=3345402 RepID=UPI00362C33BE